jgi:predicted alpha/beta-hydrolase family hydrolase
VPPAWDTPPGLVSVALDLPPAHRPGAAPALVLAHGAGSDMHHPSLAGLAAAAARGGMVACRFNFPYREAGRRIPDRLPALVACYAAIVARLRADRDVAPPWIAIGGRSLGGRVASHVAAAGTAVRALVFLAFPLHPAGRPTSDRAAHLAALDLPMLFVQGTRDALADWRLFTVTVAGLRSATVHAIESGDHSWSVPKRIRPAGSVAGEIEGVVVSWLRALAR